VTDTINHTLEPVFQYKDDRYLGLSSNRYNLVLNIDQQRFVFSLVDGVSNQCIRLEDYLLPTQTTPEQQLKTLQKLVSKHDILASMFWQSVTVMFNNQSFTLIPQLLFRREYASRYLLLARGTMLQPDEEIHYYSHESIKAINVYSVYNKLYDWLLELYPFQDIQFMHQSSAYIEQTLKATNNMVAVYCEKTAFTMIYTENGKLIFCNRFLYKQSSDFVYYVMFCLQQLKIDTQKVSIQLFGEISTSADIYQELEKIISSIQIGTLTSHIKISPDINAHQYLPLMIA
jgi:Protein of unknown function (DUF3822)